MKRFILLLLLTIIFFFISRYIPEKKTIRDIVSTTQKGTKGDYAIVIKHLRNNDLYTQQSNKSYMAASLYKLWVMAAVYQEIKDGNLKQDEILSSDVTTLNAAFGIESAGPGEAVEGAVSFSVAEALEQMITISHNYAALLLANKVGDEKITHMLKKLQLNGSSYTDTPRTTANDVALFFEKLYKGEVVDKASSQAMLALLKKQQINDRIPKYLPKEVAVGHKTGEIDYFKHDAGIVFAPKGDYIFVILSESESPEAAAEHIATLSKVIYDYFDSKTFPL